MNDVQTNAALQVADDLFDAQIAYIEGDAPRAERYLDRACIHAAQYNVTAPSWANVVAGPSTTPSPDDSGEAQSNSYTYSKESNMNIFTTDSPRPMLSGTCICELDHACLLLYRSIEYGFELSEEVLNWLPAHVADMEATCESESHYPKTMLDELLCRDPETFGEADPAKYWDGVEDFCAAYAKRTEEGGRFVETQDGSDLALDRDAEDYQTRIRAHEMAKKRELRDEMLKLGLDPREQAAWVKRAIDFKRKDALAEKARLDKESYWTVGHELPTESQIRLKAYSYCLWKLRKA
ncbi:MAG: hypothetical protein H0U53_02410 [Actinobacteria bacterium]|nr:hypothetical protein [Actinomycetota bacterium]